jgi:hypothetical protein
MPAAADSAGRAPVLRELFKKMQAMPKYLKHVRPNTKSFHFLQASSFAPDPRLHRENTAAFVEYLTSSTESS